MKYTNILEKLQYLFATISQSFIYTSFICTIVLLIILYILKKINRKKLILSLITSYLCLFIIEVIFNYNELSKILNSIMLNLFTNIYFPSTYSYLFVLFVVDISFFISILKIKLNNIYRKVNTIVFLIMQFILILIMDIISKNNIDIFSKKSLFTNTNLVIMLELSINVFIIWLLILFVTFIINTLTEKALIKEEEHLLSTKEVLMPETTINIEANNNELQEEYISEQLITNKEPTTTNIEINNNEEELIKEKEDFNLNDLVARSTNYLKDSMNIEVENNIKDKDKPNDIVDMLINNAVPVIKNEKTKEEYTLNDYKTFNKMLKEIRLYNLGSIVNIDRGLELRLLDKFSQDEYNLFKNMLKNYSN